MEILNLKCSWTVKIQEHNLFQSIFEGTLLTISTKAARLMVLYGVGPESWPLRWTCSDQRIQGLSHHLCIISAVNIRSDTFSCILCMKLHWTWKVMAQLKQIVTVGRSWILNKANNLLVIKQCMDALCLVTNFIIYLRRNLTCHPLT